MLVSRNLSHELSKMVSGNVLAVTVQTVLLTFWDFCKFIDGKLSSGEVLKSALKNLTIAASGVAGAVAGGAAATQLGLATGLAGLAMPVLGAALVASFVANLFSDDSAKREQEAKLRELNNKIDQMYPFFRTTFARLAEDFLLSQEEAEEVLEFLKARDLPVYLIEMHESSNKASYATRIIRPVILGVISKRPVTRMPSEKDITSAVLT